MIIQAFMYLCTSIIQLTFSWVNLPPLPDSVHTTMDTYFGYIFDNLSFLSFFVNINTLKIVAGVAIGLFAFEHIYKIMIWIIHKLPLSID